MNIIKSYPPVIGTEQLAEILGKTVKTVTKDRCQFPHRLPPGYKAPGSRKVRYLTKEVLEWQMPKQKLGREAEEETGEANKKRATQLSEKIKPGESPWVVLYGKL